MRVLGLVLYKIFPFVEFWTAQKEIDRDQRLADYEKDIDELIDEFSGELANVIGWAENAHYSELERSARLDSKANNYLGNIGVVLGILSISPIIAVLLGVDGESVFSADWLGRVTLAVFGYSVLAMLLSAYYSSKALKMRAFSVYFTAHTMKEWLEYGWVDDNSMVEDLLVAKRNNEIFNLGKTNAISVAGSLSRNGIIGLGIGICLASLNFIPVMEIVTWVRSFSPI